MNFVFGIYDVLVVDEVMFVFDDEVICGGWELVLIEGLLVGIFFGVVVYVVC